MVILDTVKIEETSECYRIIESGRKFQQEQGFTQWTDEYPNLELIQSDVRNQIGHVVKVDGALAGYMCIDFDGEPAYEEIEGQWSSEAAYAAVHRMAFSEKYRGIGLADITWKLIGEYCQQNGFHYIRIDTDFPNTRMQHVLEKNGFQRCGIITYQEGQRIAYDKVLK